MLSYEFIEKLCKMGGLTIKQGAKLITNGLFGSQKKILRAAIVWAYSECCEHL